VFSTMPLAAISEKTPASLSDEQKATLKDLLGRVDDMIRKQQAAREALADAEKALAGNDFQTAKSKLTLAAACEQLPKAERDKAAQQLTVVDEKIKIASTPKPPAELPVEPKPVAELGPTGRIPVSPTCFGRGIVP
ncbi:MAG: hypothetical protein R6X12_09815, partial [bacterium]